MRHSIEHGVALAVHAEMQIRTMPRWEIVTPASLGVVTFRATELDDDAHRGLVEGLTGSGVATLSSTELRGRTVLRLCTLNPSTGPEDVDLTLDTLERLAAPAGTGSRRDDQRGTARPRGVT